ncbi:alpha-glucosyltransferase N-terminal domain-containing protein [Bacillus velezensis]|uniref:alpha-glucosyltransferase N-terminal domain-containing protein n=1 Tax=Bacillus TaxID=1386 RepID=UPI0018ECFD12|nr:alpha-glucosyltransferase N-terminal domain-containing protein [Bacillus velezensis]MCM3445741.1 glycosyltransferase [Bacillus velezensis]MED3229354.1 alpha-glucosyltransferase N-terminal domain-containing protein [Bacillus velezensis]MED4624442.1 alpha-glucosyltransferase N-terminal domain-containing protein [Bacillus velezensis]QPV77168.1 glycosyltransferase [Bacillus velezensis]
MSNQPINDNNELPDMMYYFISGGLPDDYGGLTKSLLLRSKLFGEESQKNTAFLTFKFDLEFRRKKNELFERKKTDPQYTQVINMYDDFLSKRTKGKRIYSEKIELNQIKKHVSKGKVSKTISKMFGKSSNDYNLSNYSGSDDVRYVDYLNDEKQVIKREEYNKEGKPVIVSHFDTKTNQIFLQEFINNENVVYLEKHFMWDDQSEAVKFTHFTWYSEEDPLTFKDEFELRRHWIDILQKENDRPKLFLVDSRLQDKHVFRVKKAPSSYYAAIIHNKHYGDNKFQIKGRYKELFGQINNLDAVFFITEEQIADFSLISGEKETFFFTPHTINKPLDEEVLKVPSERNKAVIISRIVPMKNLTHAVKAFKLVVNEIPDAKLEIFGSGGETEKIKKEIKAQNLKNNVLLKGYTNNPDYEFQKAWLTISTSHFEGFGLSNMEALSNGCPVVTYDYDYGARSLVEDGVNGYVIEQYNIEKLAEAIISLMRDDSTHKQFSRLAFKMAEKYSKPNYIKNWSYALFKMVEVRKEKERLAEKVGSKEHPITSFEKNASGLAISVSVSDQNDAFEKVRMVGIDRKNKSEIISVSADQPAQPFYIDFEKDIQKEKIDANHTSVLDFYIQYITADHIRILRRVSSREVNFGEKDRFMNNGYTFEPYTTVKGNFSIKLNKKDHID